MPVPTLIFQIDYSHASATFLGWVVAAYSFGQLVGSPVFGITADYVPTIIPLIVSLVISIIFNILYSYCGAFQDGDAGWVLLVSRALVGFGAGETSKSSFLPFSLFGAGR